MDNQHQQQQTADEQSSAIRQAQRDFELDALERDQRDLADDINRQGLKIKGGGINYA